MCGICGVVSLSGDLDPEVRASVPAMAARLAHRGPDGDGFLHQPWVSLAHRRLAIIDRAGGTQPLSNEDGSVWIAFNGEIYNHRELRKTLVSRGHVFRTDSDTEAIVHAYEEYGEQVVDHLHGMFAFAVVNLRTRQVLLGRDRLGKKPLYYGVFNGVLHFASELKALTASPLWNGALDFSALEGYFSLGYFLSPNTIYQHVHTLEPGHILGVRGGSLTKRKYWDVDEFDTDTRPTTALVDELDERLAAAVAARLESEVPLGAFLSGGIDSGLVVSYMDRGQGGQPPLTTSVGFAESAHNELGRAALTASRFGTNHTEAIVEPMLQEVLGPIVSTFDEPFADPSAIPTYYLSRIARQHVTVALSGDGGDESFGGYDFRYVPHALEARVRPLLGGPTGQRAASWLGARWPRSPALPRPLRLGNVLENLGGDAASAYYRDLCFQKPQDARALMGRVPLRTPADSPVFDAVTSAYRRCTSTDALQCAQYADLKVYLPNGPLVKVDRMSMAHGLEIRSPLLDHRIVEFAFRIPASLKCHIGASKYLLRELATRRLPAAVASGPKRGFTAPIGAWIGGCHAQQFRADVLSPSARSRSVIDTDHVARMFDEHRHGGVDHSFALWAVWVFERWAQLQARSAWPAPGPTPAALQLTSV